MMILCLILLSTLTEALSNDWVDPHSMDTNAKKKYQRSNSDSSQVVTKNNGEYLEIASAEEAMSLMYLKRIVSLLLNSASSENHNPNVYVGSYRYALDSEEYKFLKDFTTNKKINTEDVRRLDTVLSTLFSKPYFNNIFTFTVPGENFVNSVLSKQVLIVVGTGISLFVFYTLLRRNVGFLYIFSYFLSIIVIVDYGFRYRHLYEEAEEHNLKLEYTMECDTKEMNWSEYFKFVLSHKNCEKKMVSPLDVALFQLKHLIIIPMESIGTGAGKLGKELWHELPFPWNLLIFPIMLIFILTVTFIFVLALKGTTLKLNLLHLLNLQLGGEHNHKQGINEKTIEKILDAAASHRKMVEDSRSTPQRTEPDTNTQNKTEPEMCCEPPKVRFKQIMQQQQNKEPITININITGKHEESSENNKALDVIASKDDTSETDEVVDSEGDNCN